MIPQKVHRGNTSQVQKLVQSTNIDPDKLSKALTAAARILRGDQAVKVTVKKRGEVER